MIPRIKHLEDERTPLVNELASKKEELIAIHRELSNLESVIPTLKTQATEKEQEAILAKTALEVEKEIRLRSEAKEEQERTERIAACAQLLATQTECTYKVKHLEEKISSERISFDAEMEKLRSDNKALRNENINYNEVLARKDSELSELKHAMEHAIANHEAVVELGQLKGEIEVLRRRAYEASQLKQSECTATAKRIKELEQQIAHGDAQRRKLHNLVQELRGNVRVFARVRPFLPNDAQLDTNIQTISLAEDSSTLKIIKYAKTAEERNEEFSFSFDKAFGPSSSQEIIFDEVSEFVQSALDGFNVCLFSYGQTGSGKTHTMQGSGGGPMKGIIPRAMKQVGEYKLKLEEKGWSYVMQISFVEIYNETIRVYY